MSVEAGVVDSAVVVRQKSSRMQKIVNYFNWQAYNGRFPNSPDFYSYVSFADPSNPVAVVKYLNELDTSAIKIQYGTAQDLNGLTKIKNLRVDLRNPDTGNIITWANLDIVEPFANNLKNYNSAFTEEDNAVNYFMFLPIPATNKTLSEITDEITSLDHNYVNTYGSIKTYSFLLSSEP
uniref:Uncharacterized protein n=1 Tax=viral metagenome TaxID=1070528 RepID=A0A6C0BC46_9ZZZZ